MSALGQLLVVDDKQEFRKEFAGALEARGFEVVFVETSHRAYELLDEQRRALGQPRITTVLTDWGLNAGDGLGLLGSIRKSPFFKDLPVVLISGVVTREQLASALRLDADGVLLKPFTVELLCVKIAEAVAHRQMKEFNRKQR